MNYARLSSLTALLIPVAGSAHSMECRLEQTERTADDLLFAVICDDGHTDAVRYPAGELYLGLSLYAPDLPLASMEGVVVPGTDPGEAVDLAPMSFEAAPGKQEFRFAIAAPAGRTHYLAVVWDARNECGGSNGVRCGTVGFTLGRVDADGLPYPVDAYPRPICETETLENVGYFEAVRNGEIDFEIQNAFPEDINDHFLANDCWRYSTELPGLGYSVKTWRMAPLSPE